MSKTIKINRLPKNITNLELSGFSAYCLMESYPDLKDIYTPSQMIDKELSRFKNEFEKDIPSYRKYVIRNYQTYKMKTGKTL